jgi:DNA (cytosine-5)-methyltransferase 1
VSKTKTKTWKTIDLFSGAGGLTAGFSSLFGRPFETVLALDFNADAARSFNANFGERCRVGDIVAWLADPKTKVPAADVVLGGPPCQGFSLLNKKRRGDDRRQLWRPYLEVVERSGASVFVMENVRQLLGSPEHDEIVAAARALGFRTAHAVLHAADYGVPQMRKRAFIVGCRFADPSTVFPPAPTHADPRKKATGARKFPWSTVRDAFQGLRAPVGTDIRAIAAPLDLHFGRTPTAVSLARYKSIPDEGMNRFDLQAARPDLTPECWVKKTKGGTDLFGRLWWDRPAFTIRTEFFKPEKGRYLHPREHRPITHREAARLQSFPDAFRFLGSKTEIARQIGNAVPPLLAAAVASSVEALLEVARRRAARKSDATKAANA